MKIKRLLQLGTAFVVALSSIFIINVGQVFATVHNCTWIGATNDNFNTATNWSNCNSTAPQSGDTMVFDNSGLGADADLNNDINGLDVSAITFQGNGTHKFTLSGNAMTVTGGISNVMSACTSDSCYATINNNITLSGAQTLNASSVQPATTYLIFGGALSGSSLITVTGGGGVWLQGNNSSLTGGISSSATTVSAYNANALGTGTATISGTAALYLQFDSDTTFSTPLSLSGSGDVLGATIYMSTVDGAAPAGDHTTVTWTGPITLASDVKFGAFGYRTFKIAGALSGQFAVAPLEGDSNATVNNLSSNNTSKTPSGIVPIVISSSDHQASLVFTAYSGTPYVLDGIRGDGTVNEGGILKGTGTAGNLTVESGGVIAPGHSPGCLNTGNLTLAGTYQAEIGGTAACTGYDQLNVSGTVNLTGGSLTTSLYDNYKPSVGEAYTIIKNDGSDGVTGTFANLPEGATFTVGGNVFQVTYKGGDGNDVVLIVKSVPATPDTGFGLIYSHPVIGLIGAFLIAGGLYGLSRRVAPARRW